MAKSPIYTGIWDNEYFDETDMFLYIGDVWVDEVVHLAYNVEQQKTPIYGYASQLFDTTAAGHVLVTGQFSINFKEAGYLWTILRRYFRMSGDKSPTNDFLDRKLADKMTRGLDSIDIGNQKPVIGSNGTNVNRASIERITQGNITKKEQRDFYYDLSSYATHSVKSPKDKVFEDITEAFEDEIWKKDNQELIEQLRRTDSNVFDGFDIYVTFGNYSVKAANHTCEQIVGVRLVGRSKTIQIDGGNVIETYNFIAKSLV